MSNHSKDSDCTVNADEYCDVCGVDHCEQCDFCKGRGFHLVTCDRPDIVADRAAEALQR